MFIPGSLLGVFFALTSAFVWGGGDFSGGFATRRTNEFQVLVLSALSGIAVLVLCAVLFRESLLSMRSALWAVAGGAAGALGIAALYRALSMGHTASVAPTAGVIGAVLPVAFGIITEGMPSAMRLVGFACAFVGIWLVSSSSSDQGAVSPQGFLLACLAGIGFGGFFILIAQVEPGKIWTPLIVARAATFVVAILLLRMKRLAFPAFTSNPIALLAGVLDAGGNVFYLLARQLMPLEIAAVLSSMYPASTVLLAGIILKEKVSRTQGLGVLVCLAAIALITV